MARRVCCRFSYSITLRYVATAMLCYNVKKPILSGIKKIEWQNKIRNQKIANSGNFHNCIEQQ